MVKFTSTSTAFTAALLFLPITITQAVTTTIPFGQSMIVNCKAGGDKAQCCLQDGVAVENIDNDGSILLGGAGDGTQQLEAVPCLSDAKIIDCKTEAGCGVDCDEGCQLPFGVTESEHKDNNQTEAPPTMNEPESEVEVGNSGFLWSSIPALTGIVIGISLLLQF